jgi:hypothetical protein
MPEYELPQLLRWDPGLIYDPVPEWWMQRLDDQVVREVLSIKLKASMRMVELQQEALKVQHDALMQSSELLGR